jgi:hypothetical protein
MVSYSRFYQRLVRFFIIDWLEPLGKSGLISRKNNLPGIADHGKVAIMNYISSMLGVYDDV